MGMRSHIVVESKYADPITIYSHWGGDANHQAVMDVLEVTDRIGDPAYLTAQLFHRFADLSAYDGKLGMGLMAGKDVFDADVPTLYVNADLGTYLVGKSFELELQNA